VRVALAQIDCVLGDIPENVRRVREALARARADGADLVVFPELALTGYAIGQTDEDVARSLDDPELVGLLADTEEVACVVGFAEDGPVHTYNSMAYLEGGTVRHVHRKVHLPTYDIWEERKHFTPGGAMRAFDARAGRVAILLCGDAWQPALAVLAVQDGARMLIVPAASTLGDREDIAREWHEITRFYARMLQCYVVFVNRVGTEPGLRFWGGSHVRDPWGEIVAKAPHDEPALVSAHVDLTAVRRRRREYPLIKEARLALLSRELERLAAEGGDL
jgi:predicted amidohydrolase